MRVFTLVLIIFLSFQIQAQQWEWVKRIDGIGNDYISDMHVDSLGNIYVTGRDKFSGVIFYDDSNPITPNSYGHRDAFIAKYDKNGNLIWANQAGGIDPDWGWGVVSDNYGYAYYTGTFADTAYFGNDTLISQGLNDVFISKLDTNGNYVWAISFGNTSQDRGQDITMDSQGNLYCTGEVTSEVTLNGTTIGTPNIGNAFILKLDTSGTILNVESIEPARSKGLHIESDKKGNIYVSGFLLYNSYVAGYLVAGPLTRNWADGFIAKLDTTLTTQWVNTVDGSFSNTSESIAISNNYVYTTGSYSYICDFSGISLTYNGNGTNSATINAAADTYVAQYDFDGNIQWVKGFGGVGSEYGYGIKASEDDHIYFSGVFHDTVMFDTTQLIAAGSADIFISRLDVDGNVVWAKQQGDNESDYNYCIGIDDHENIYSAGGYGFFNGGKYFDDIFMLNNENAAYLGKITQHTYPSIEIDTNNTCLNDTLFFNINSLTTPITYEFNLAPSNGWLINDTYYFTLDNSNTLVGNIIVSNNIYSDTLFLSESFANLTTPIAFSLGNDTTICDYNTDLNLNGPSNQNGYDWSTSETTNSITVNQTGVYWLEVIDTNNCMSSDSIAINFIDCTDIEENNLISIQYFQNNSLLFDSNIDNYIIYTLEGKVLKSGINQSKVDVENFTPGIYILVVKENNTINHLKFVVN